MWLAVRLILKTPVSVNRRQDCSIVTITVSCGLVNVGDKEARADIAVVDDFFSLPIGAALGRRLP